MKNFWKNKLTIIENRHAMMAIKKAKYLLKKIGREVEVTYHQNIRKKNYIFMSAAFNRTSRKKVMNKFFKNDVFVQTNSGC